MNRIPSAGEGAADFATGVAFDFAFEAEYERNRWQEYVALPSLPARLKLPLELELIVLSFADRWCDLWLRCRLVCKTWRDHIEVLAKRKWVPCAYLHFPSPSRNNFDALSVWRFQHLDSNTIVFRNGCSGEQNIQARVRNCRRVGCPDVVLGHYVFKIKIPGITFDWEGLTARVPWRAFVARIFAEENEVDAEIKQEARVERAARALRRGKIDGRTMRRALLTGFGGGTERAYATVHKRRWGAVDVEAAGRLQQLRFAAGNFYCN
ncbi:hypothetical protein AURDEDRAFT_163977 [Auricularia subglabra TFB-10046 SS5]|nr:hypothetical protein AURDEDRAFT_163977 [Auricularia subglabra TFB-10046 SS5]